MNKYLVVYQLPNGLIYNRILNAKNCSKEPHERTIAKNCIKTTTKTTTTTTINKRWYITR